MAKHANGGGGGSMAPVLLAVVGGLGLLLLWSRSTGAAYPAGYGAELAPGGGPGGVDWASYLYGAGREAGLTEAEQAARKSPLAVAGTVAGLIPTAAGVVKTVTGTVAGATGSSLTGVTPAVGGFMDVFAVGPGALGVGMPAAEGAMAAGDISAAIDAAVAGQTAAAPAAESATVAAGLTGTSIAAAAAGLAAVAGVIVAGQIGLKQDVTDFRDSFTEGIQPEMQRPIAARIADVRNLGAVIHTNILISVAWDALYALGFVSNRDFWPTDPNEMDKVTQPAGYAGRERAKAEGLVAPMGAGADLTYSLPEIGRDIATRWGRLPSKAEYDETIYQLARRSYVYPPSAPVVDLNRMTITTPTGPTPAVAAGGQILSASGAPTQSYYTSMGDFGR